MSSSSEPSILVVVEKITDAISDAISQLMAMVVDLQGKNAPIPAALPKHTEMVAESCQRLVGVAKDLADAEYEDFPEIQEEIKFAASDVGRSAQTLSLAVRNLQGTKDRQNAWTRLVDSCKVIAEMTVLLLQIVYGAEVKKIVALQKKANLAVLAVDVFDVEENKKRFAEMASAAASAAVELADSLRGRANETPLPMKKDALLRLADALEQQAKDVMDRANELLRLPGDPKRIEKLQDALQKLQKTMKAALVPIEEDYIEACNPKKWSLQDGNARFAQRMDTDPLDRKRAIEQLIEAVKAGDKPLIKDALDRVEWELDDVAALAKRVQGVRPEASEALEAFNLRRRGLRPVVKEAEKEGVKKLETFWVDLMDAQAKLMDEILPVEDRVMQLVQEQLFDMDRVKRALRNNDGSVVSITKNVWGTHKDLMRAADACHSGWKKGKPKRFKEAMSGANGILGGYIKGVAEAVKDAESRPRLYHNSQDLALALEDVCAEALPIEDALILAGEQQVKDLRAQHDPNRADWSELQHSIEQRNPRLERVAREAKEHKDEVAQRRKLKMGKGTIPDDADVEQELRKLRSVGEQQKVEAANKGPDWLRVNLRHVEAVQDAVAAALTPKSRLVYLAEKALEDLRLGGDPVKFSKGPGQALEHHVDRIVDEGARVAGGLYDGAARDRLKKLVDQMQPMRKELAACKDPREFAKLNQRLADATRQLIREVVNPVSEIQALADRALKALDAQLVDAPRGDEAAVTRNNAELDDAADRLAELADFAARHAGNDYAAKHRIRAAGKVLREEPPAHAAHSLRAVAAPKETAPMRDVKTADRKLRQAIESLVGETATPEVQLAAIARQLMQHVDELSESVRDGGEHVDVHTQASLEGALAKRLATQADRVKAKLADPVVAQQLERALADVNDLLPQHLGSVHDVAEDPSKKEAQRALTTDAQSLKDAVLAVLGAANSSPEEELLAHRHTGRDALLHACAKARQGEGAAAEAAGHDAAKKFREVERHARDVATRIQPDVARSIPVEEAAFQVRTEAEAAPDLLKAAADTGSPAAALAAEAKLHAVDSLGDSAARDGAARFKGEARKLQRALQGTVAGLLKGDPVAVVDRIKEAADRFAEVAQLGEAEAKTRGGKEEKQILDAIAALKAGIPDLAFAATVAMKDNWDAESTERASDLGRQLAQLAADLAEGGGGTTARAASSVPADDRRGKRLWNAVSPNFVGREELAAAERLEKLLPALKKAGHGAPLEAALATVEKEAGRLGRHEVSDAVRLAHLARLADSDVQHVNDEVAAGRDAGRLCGPVSEAGASLPREAKSLAQQAGRADAKQLESAANAVEVALPAVVDAVKAGKVGELAKQGEASHLALAAIANSLDPGAELTLLELRDAAGEALDGLRQGVPEKWPALNAKLAALRGPTLQALAEALRKADVLSGDDGVEAVRGAEELARLWAGLPATVRSGDEAMINAKATRMESLLDALMQVTAAFPCGVARRIDVDLGRMQVAARRGDRDEAQALAKGIVSDMKDLESAANQMSDSMEDKKQGAKLRQAIKDAKLAFTATMKCVPEFVQAPHDAIKAAELDGLCCHVRAPLSSAINAIWDNPETRFREDVRHAEASLAQARTHDDPEQHLNDVLRRLPALVRNDNESDVESLRTAVTRCRTHDARSDSLVVALQNARRKLWVVANEGGRSDPEGSLEHAKGLLAAETVRARRGVADAPNGVILAAKRLIEGTRANYRAQRMETFDLSALEEAGAQARRKQGRSLQDVLNDIRKARQARDLQRKQREEEEARARSLPAGKGAFGDMQDDINANLKKMVVGSSLDFEGERVVQLIRSIATDFGEVGQCAQQKNAEKMIEAGRNASKHITELVAELNALAKATPDPRASNDLIRAAQVLKDFAVRTKLFTSIKAASLHTRGGDEAMVTFSKELGTSILSCVQVFYTARIKIHGGKK